MDQIIELGKQITQSNLSFDEFIKALEFINLKLRGKDGPDEDTGIYQGDMIVDRLISPSNEIQLKILKKLYDTLNEDLNPTAKGMICYYTLNNLHLFHDCNGRTSRFFYQLYCNEFDETYLYHPDSVEDTSKRTNFESEHDLFSAEKFLNIANYQMFLKMLSNGTIYDCERMHKYSQISTYPVEMSVEDHFDTTFLSTDVVKELGSAAKEVARNISNRNCSFSIAGLAMCELLTSKNQMPKVIESNDQYFRQIQEKYKTNMMDKLLFYIGSNDEYGCDVHTEKWDAQTCREYVSISEKLLLEQYDKIVELSKYYADKKGKIDNYIDSKEDLHGIKL